MSEEEKRRKPGLRKLGKVSFVLVILLLLILGAFLTIYVVYGKINEDNSMGQPGAGTEEQLCIYQDWSDAFFLSDANGKTGMISAAPSVLIYWASWCPHCRESMAQAGALYEEVRKTDANFYLVNKLDGIKETEKSAEEYLTDNQIGIPSVYDKDARVYQEKGLHMVPTVIVLDKQGRVTSFLEGEIPDKERLKSMISEAETGKGKYLEKAILNNMLTAENGIRTNYLEGNGDVPSGEDELSESMGFMLLYAADTENKELYDRLLSRLLQTRFSPGQGNLFPWAVTSKKNITVNAAVDDFRIYRAQKTAEGLWGKNKEFDGYAKALYECLVKEGRLCDFYETSDSLTSDMLTLCYADFSAIQLMAEEEREWKRIYKDTLKLVKQGKISESFPLFYRQYNYREARYTGTDLNMAEALVTFLHLARIEELPEDSYDWMKNRIEEGVIYAGYGADNRPLADKRFESTAVYALAALIAMEKKDMYTAGLAFNLMESFRIRNGDNELDGLFGEEDGSGIYSFDQCVALQAYQKMEELIGRLGS